MTDDLEEAVDILVSARDLRGRIFSNLGWGGFIFAGTLAWAIFDGSMLAAVPAVVLAVMFVRACWAVALLDDLVLRVEAEIRRVSA